MESKAIQKFLSMLPASEKRDTIMRALNTAIRQKEKAKDGGLQDDFSFKPTGHIMIEEIDANGQVVGVLADQPNLVVKGSEEILLRAFSGDPKRTLYKNRKIKEYRDAAGATVNGISKPYNVALATITAVLDGEDVVPHHQNEIWKAVADEDFEVEYSYYPNTLYVKAEALPLEPGKLTFKLYDKANAPVGSAPLQAEVYSNYSNLFIGLGDGKNKVIPFADNRLTVAEGFTEDAGTLVSAAAGDTISFNAKITNFKIVALASNEGAKIEITVAGESKGEFDLHDGDLAAGLTEERTFEFGGFDATAATEVVVKTVAGTGTKVVVKEIAFDEFSVGDSALMGEFENFTRRFDTETIYNANAEKGPENTFTLQLDQFPVKAGTLKLSYDGAELEKVETIAELSSGKFFAELETGVVHLADPLTAVLASYEVTGEIHQDEPHTAMGTTSVSIVRTTIQTSGDLTLTPDGSTLTFPLGFQNIQNPETVVVKLDGTALAADDFTLNAVAGEVTLRGILVPGTPEVLDPTDGSVITPAVPDAYMAPTSANTLEVESFEYEQNTPVSLNAYTLEVLHEITGNQVRVKDHGGNELEFVETTAELTEGRFTLVDDAAGLAKKLIIVKENEALELITRVDVYYNSLAKLGVPTGYTRQVIEKPKTQNEYPWFQLDKGKIVFVAEFPEKTPNHNVTIREMGLFDGPRVEDNIRGFNNYNVKAFSLVRVGETRKEATTGLRVTWTITLLNEEGEPFRGGL